MILILTSSTNDKKLEIYKKNLENKLEICEVFRQLSRVFFCNFEFLSMVDEVTISSKLKFRYRHEFDLELFFKLTQISELICETKFSSDLLYDSEGKMKFWN